VRLSALDFLPFEDGAGDRTAPVDIRGAGYPYAFGGDGTGLGSDLAEPLKFLDLLHGLGIRLVCISAGAEYNSHLMEPYLSLPVAPHKPPEDPLIGVARLISLVAELRSRRPELIYVGSGYSYLQQWFPNVAQAVVGNGLADFVGIGRLSFSYPDILADILEGRPLQRQRLCRACGFCDVAPAFGIKSGCYALDDFYRDSSECRELKRHFKEA